jgi:hypothetical protein
LQAHDQCAPALGLFLFYFDLLLTFVCSQFDDNGLTVISTGDLLNLPNLTLL